ncbi:hypothetical protein [Mesobacterium pallidum]|uniref:hypothetical protein n=1 Tax=Mesobacterium pallidum TaxID=2872037 RepID=UPI001EE34D3E|nr:hypothetical protein [Mesobacterium pallidum]
MNVTELLQRLTDPHGVKGSELQALLDGYYAEGNRSAKEKSDDRSGLRPYKKIRDEVSPIDRFLRWAGLASATVYFPMDNTVPDCTILLPTGQTIQLEVTTAGSRERKRTAEQLNREGISRGFSGLRDDATRDEEQERLEQPPQMYSTVQAIDTISKAISLSLAKKNDRKYEGMALLVAVDLVWLGPERWKVLPKLLKSDVDRLPFSEVYLIHKDRKDLLGFQLKGTRF